MDVFVLMVCSNCVVIEIVIILGVLLMMFLILIG